MCAVINCLVLPEDTDKVLRNQTTNLGVLVLAPSSGGDLRLMKSRQTSKRQAGSTVKIHVIERRLAGGHFPLGNALKHCPHRNRFATLFEQRADLNQAVSLL